MDLQVCALRVVLLVMGTPRLSRDRVTEPLLAGHLRALGIVFFPSSFSPSSYVCPFFLLLPAWVSACLWHGCFLSATGGWDLGDASFLWFTFVLPAGCPCLMDVRKDHICRILVLLELVILY